MACVLTNVLILQNSELSSFHIRNIGSSNSDKMFLWVTLITRMNLDDILQNNTVGHPSLKR